MTDMNYTERDWKLFRERIAAWQESYMDKLCREYVDILSASGSSANRFWTIEKRIKQDQKKIGVCAEMSRSKLIFNIASLIREGAISMDDLDGFSEKLKESVLFLAGW